jgi:KTSC domain
MKWTPVESSAFQAAAYAERQALLYLLFRSGEVYRYFDVPRGQYPEFLAAESKGRYFGRNIRGRFRYERMRWPR